MDELVYFSFSRHLRSGEFICNKKGGIQITSQPLLLTIIGNDSVPLLVAFTEAWNNERNLDISYWYLRKPKTEE